jgi:hypothetical protein
MLNPIEEAKFADLKAMCRELKVPPPPEIMIGLKVHDKNGILTFDDVQRGHSWVRNYWNYMFMGMTIALTDSTTTNIAGTMSQVTTDGSTLTQSNYGAALQLGSAASSLLGIIVGTGDTAESVNTISLAAQIYEGSTAGQFSHALQTRAQTYASKIWKQTLSRIFNNNSGSSITVKETGMLNNWNGYCVLMERSVLFPTVAVANGAQLTVTYEISMDFSAID